MNKKNVVIFCLFFCLCSPPTKEGIVSLSGDTTTTTTINIEDYPIVLTQCLNEEKGYDIVTPFDIQDLKTTISQLSTSKDEELQLGEDVNRSEERRVGKEGRSRMGQENEKKKRSVSRESEMGR